ncbi:uncharacterized protein B0T15DRAFT_85528 [Chaetomium strumarium]|uniref:Uncharacterized protein n=1 Tax=Chaetomium strumarium TaxID=1170767 RepID=A0AAJ0M3P2_9PEZI|nr:hypothetical protein B0T15DRAFT_85528 [Chaetomium strumarium]
MRALFSLLVQLALLRTCFGKKCYYPNGNEAGIDWACDENAENSPCCAGAPFGFACLENGLCQGKDGKVIRGSCTDETWMSPECPHFCLNWDSVGHDLVPCSNVTGRDTSYCCDEMPNCCDGGVGRFEVPPSNPKTWALLNSESRQYVVVTPRSTTSSSASKTSDASAQPTTDSAEPSTAATSSANTIPAQTASGDSTDNQSQAEPSGQSTGLSTGAQAGIGVGAAVGALLVGAVAYLWWKLNKIKKMAEATGPMPGSYPQPAQGLPMTTYYAGDARHSQKSELPVEPVAHELQGYHPHIQQGEAELAGFPLYSPVATSPSSHTASPHSAQ